MSGSFILNFRHVVWGAGAQQHRMFAFMQDHFSVEAVERVLLGPAGRCAALTSCATSPPAPCFHLQLCCGAPGLRAHAPLRVQAAAANLPRCAAAASSRQLAAEAAVHEAAAWGGMGAEGLGPGAGMPHAAHPAHPTMQQAGQQWWPDAATAGLPEQWQEQQWQWQEQQQQWQQGWQHGFGLEGGHAAAGPAAAGLPVGAQQAGGIEPEPDHMDALDTFGTDVYGTGPEDQAAMKLSGYAMPGATVQVRGQAAKHAAPAVKQPSMQRTRAAAVHVACSAQLLLCPCTSPLQAADQFSHTALLQFLGS